MARTFSIPTVLRMAPNALLKELFVAVEFLEFDGSWKGLKEREIEPIQRAISEAPREIQTRLETELHDLFALAYDAGIESILEAAELSGEEDFVARLPASGGVYHKVLWVRLNHPDVFARALRIHRFEVLSWWRKRNDLPAKQIQVDGELQERLAAAISNYFGGTQGRGFPCTVNHFTRGDGTEYFYAEPDDFAYEANQHNEEHQLTPVTIRTTFSVVFAYNSSEGSLELHTKVAAKAKRQLEKLFCEVVLGHELGDWKPEAAYELNHLKDRNFSLATDPEDRIRAQIRKMRLAAKNTGRRGTIEISHEFDNIHDALDEWINPRQVPLNEVDATRVTFRFEFLELEGRKEGSETFDVAWPNTCNLNGRRPERVAIIRKCLKQWDVDVSTAVVRRPGAAEPEAARAARA